MRGLRPGDKAKCTFFIMLIFTVLPMIAFSYVSSYYHQVYSAPKIQNGVLDLSGYDLSSRKPIPLDGKWEFYYDKWILSENLKNPVPDYLAVVPGTWNSYDDKRIDNTGKSSYRILLKNCPEGMSLFANISNINSRYRIYLNGILVSGRGNMNIKGLSSGYPDDMIVHLETYVKDVPTAGGDAELTIEMVSNHVGGLYITPTLTEFNQFHKSADTKNMVTSAAVGILVVLLGSFVALHIVKDKSLPSLAMLIMDIVVFVKICLQNNYFYFFRKFVPYKEYYVNLFFEVSALFLPIVFLICVKQLVNISIPKKHLRRIFIYEAVFIPIIAWTGLEGLMRVKVLLCLLAYVPFIFTIKKLYQLVKTNVPNALMISGVLMLIIAGALTSTVVRTGSLVMDISLFAPVCFTISMLLQLALYVRQNLATQRQAVIAENLRLRLKESETQLMLSQIKPHFLYNTLIAIHMLCTEEPETAAETVLKFAAFLRTNMNFISSRDPIPFKKELEHIRNYADIEKLRFQERLEIEYEIETENFALPPLTIQPLVENGIRHGACKNIDRGRLLLRTKIVDEGVCIEVVDNGPGFEPEKLLVDSQEPHGIQNVVFRLRQIKGSVEFISEPDKGCTVRVILPKEAML